MNPWIESLLALALAISGFFIGRRSARLPKSWWMLGFFLPLMVVLLYVSCLRYPTLIVHPLVAWVCLGRTKFAYFGFVAALLLSTPMHRLPRRRDRLAVGVLMLLMIAYWSVTPYLAPVFNQGELARLKTRVDSDGVCLQGTAYTCGPAAAVTVLRRLGIAAEEGELARLARTTFATGTPPEVLAAALNERYRPNSLTARLRICQNLFELQPHLPALAIVKFDFFQDHYVTILTISDTEVAVADPLQGVVKYSPAEFTAVWRHTAVTVHLPLKAGNH